jgi:GntR family carbon starvation induced transcriptional regulator
VQRAAYRWGPSARVLRTDEAKTLADEAYLRIRKDIIHGALAPGGKLQPDVLRDRYDIGLSPVREALSRLSLDGLAAAQGQRGFFVAPVSKGELLDIVDLRTQFAVLAMERAIKLGDDQWENGIVAAYYQLSKLEKQAERNPATYADEWERRNHAFHTALEAGCGSPWLLHFCEILYDQLERYRRLFVPYTQIETAIVEEHQRIMELALARDERVCGILADHFQHSYRIISGKMDKAKGEPSMRARPTEAQALPIKPIVKKRATRRSATP